MTVDPLLLEEYNKGIERALNDYWRRTSPIAAFERAVKKAERNRRNQQRFRERATSGRAT